MKEDTSSAMPTGAQIVRLQNEDRHRILLAASSDIYGRAKQVLAIQMLLTIGGAVIASLISATWPATKSWTVLYAACVSLIDSFVLERLQGRLRKIGAQIQEVFDCELFGLEWNGLTVGKQPTPEEIEHHGREFLRSHPQAIHLTAWYPTEVSPLPLHYAVLVCQRANCWWDERLRKKYLIGLAILLSFTACALTAYGLAREFTLEQFFLTVLAPILPALVWGIRECLKQSDSAKAAGKLREHVEELWARCHDQPSKVTELPKNLREIQTEIFRGRASRPLVFDWVNFLLRPKHQELMQSGALAMVKRLENHRS